MLTKFTCANLAAKSYPFNLINCRVVIYLLWSVILFSTSARAVVVAKLLIISILFSTLCILAWRATVVAMLVILGISFLTSFILALREALVSKLVIPGLSFLSLFIWELKVVLVAKAATSGILTSIFLILVLHTSF